MFIDIYYISIVYYTQVETSRMIILCYKLLWKLFKRRIFTGIVAVTLAVIRVRGFPDDACATVDARVGLARLDSTVVSCFRNLCQGYKFLFGFSICMVGNKWYGI